MTPRPAPFPEAAAPGAGPARRILIRSPEIRIKGRNRATFREALKRNLSSRLAGIGLPWKPSSSGDRVWIDVPPEEGSELDRALLAISTVFGVHSAIPAFAFARDRAAEPQSAEGVAEAAFEFGCALAAGGPKAAGDGFAVRARRRDKGFPLRSLELARRLGRAVLERTPWDRVDLGAPAFTLFVEAHDEALFLWTRRTEGPGGLPVGVAGRLLALLSGGFDSPVAAWLMAGRGAAVDFLHLTPGAADPEESSVRKVVRLVEALSRHTGRCRLLLVPYTYFDLQLTGRRTGYEALFFRRFAFRCGEEVAGRFGARALVTGDSLSQVASQTLENLATADAAVSIPVLRPLIGLDKATIMRRAERIGTWNISAEPAKDCCALIGRSPRTRSQPERVAALEAQRIPDAAALVAASLAEARIGVFAGGRQVRAFRPAPGETPVSPSVRSLPAP